MISYNGHLIAETRRKPTDKRGNYFGFFRGFYGGPANMLLSGNV